MIDVVRNTLYRQRPILQVLFASREVSRQVL